MRRQAAEYLPARPPHPRAPGEIFKLLLSDSETVIERRAAALQPVSPLAAALFKFNRAGARWALTMSIWAPG